MAQAAPLISLIGSTAATTAGVVGAASAIKQQSDSKKQKRRSEEARAAELNAKASEEKENIRRRLLADQARRKSLLAARGIAAGSGSALALSRSAEQQAAQRASLADVRRSLSVSSGSSGLKQAENVLNELGKLA